MAKLEKFQNAHTFKGMPLQKEGYGLGSFNPVEIISVDRFSEDKSKVIDATLSYKYNRSTNYFKCLNMPSLVKEKNLFLKALKKVSSYKMMFTIGKIKPTKVKDGDNYAYYLVERHDLHTFSITSITHQEFKVFLDE